MTLRPAERAGGKLSLRARVKALSMTRLQVASERCGARFPRRMVVLALIGASSSTFMYTDTHTVRHHEGKAEGKGEKGGGGACKSNDRHVDQHLSLQLHSSTRLASVQQSKTNLMCRSLRKVVKDDTPTHPTIRT